MDDLNQLMDHPQYSIATGLNWKRRMNLSKVLENLTMISVPKTESFKVTFFTLTIHTKLMLSTLI